MLVLTSPVKLQVSINKQYQNTEHTKKV